MVRLCKSTIFRSWKSLGIPWPVYPQGDNLQLPYQNHGRWQSKFYLAPMATLKDRAEDNKTKLTALDVEEFIRRFLLHVLPKGFRKIRYFEFLSPRYKTQNIEKIRELMNEGSEGYAFPKSESIQEMMLRLTGTDITWRSHVKRCPKCKKGRMVQLYELLPKHFDYIVPTQAKEICNTS